LKFLSLNDLRNLVLTNNVLDLVHSVYVTHFIMIVRKITGII